MSQSKALSAFLALNLKKEPLPIISWLLKEKGRSINLDIEASGDQLIRAVLWTSSSQSRDFRESKWTNTTLELNKKNKSKIEAKLKYSKTGFNAFYVDLFYPDINGGEYSVSTRTYVADKIHVFVK